jgi:hypothetical protein
VNGGAPRSNAGVRSTSFGMIPLLRRFIIPSFMSSSVIGGGSAKGSSLNFFGSIRFGFVALEGFFPD